jgi:glutaredoxin
MSLRTAAILVLALPMAAGAQTVYQWTDKGGAVNYADQPPPQDVKSVREKRLGSANYVETSAPSYAMSKASKEFPITLYTAPNCESECKAARDFLAQRGVPYAETALEPGDADKYRQAFGSGDVFLPAVTVGSQKQKGFEEATWTRFLDDAGYPKFAAGTGRPPQAPKGQ